jgi:pimeloyl-ACP methyl ester carboxylesterase
MKAFKACLAIAAALSLASTAVPASADPLKNIVLVHGAWVDASGWKPVYDILTKEGFHVTMVQEPETSFQDDVAAAKRVLDLQDGPTLLVGHSYGGSIITEAGIHPNVVGLVYVAAHAPDVGEDEAALDYTFSVEDGLTVADSGLVRVPVLMQIPKQDGYLNLDVTLQVSQKNGALSAGDVSVRRSRTKS